MSRYLVFITISLVLMLSSASGTAVAVAFPVITSSFDASLILAGWTLSVHQLTSIVTMPLAGKASDILGRKKVFLICLSLFSLGSLLCALAPNIQSLIFFRLIQGLGNGGFLPPAAGIVSDQFPKTRQQAIGLFTSIFPLGSIIGPNLGGWLTSAFGWRSIFWVNIPLGILALVSSALLLRSEPRKESRIDLTGAGLLVASISALMLGLTKMGDSGTATSWVFTAILFAASIILMVSFIRRERKTGNPFIDLAVLREKPFVAANIYNFILGSYFMGISSFVPLYAVSVYGMSVLESGFIVTPRSIGMVLASTVTSMSLVRWGYRAPMLTGTIAIILSLVLLGIEAPGISLAGIPLSSTILLFGIMSLAGLGMGTSAPAANNACIELMPERVATIVGVRGMFRQAGGAITIAVITLSLHNAGDMADGFRVIFFGAAIIMLIITPVIFIMPKSCRTAPSSRGEEG